MDRTLSAAVGLLLMALPAGAQLTDNVPRSGLLQWEGCPGPNSVFGRALDQLGYA